MKAVLQIAYGAPSRALAIEEIDKPKVGADQVLVRVCASSVNSGDCRIVRADPFIARLIGGIRRPKNPAFGGDAAGVVEAVGEQVTDLKAGAEVFGVRKGAIAEYVAGAMFIAKPQSLTMDQAAAMPITGITALQALRDQGGVKAGDKVLINGAGGGVGSMAVQIAKAMGADVTAVTASDKVAMVQGLGADPVLDRASDDFTKSRATYDVILDIAGDKSIGATRKALKPAGTLVVVGAHKGVLRRILVGTVRARLLKQRIRFFIADVQRSDLETLRQMVDDGKLRPVIDRTFSFADTVAAVAYAEDMQARGKVVITMAPAAPGAATAPAAPALS